MPINKKGHIIWILLLGIVVAANTTLLVMENTNYTHQLVSLHEFLLDDLESAAQENAVANWTNYSKKIENLKKIARLRPPFWKAERHATYLDTLDDLETMSSQVRPSPVSNTAAMEAGMKMMKGVDTAAMMKTLETARVQQDARRLQILPKYKALLDKWKALYAELQ